MMSLTAMSISGAAHVKGHTPTQSVPVPQSDINIGMQERSTKWLDNHRPHTHTHRLQWTPIVRPTGSDERATLCVQRSVYVCVCVWVCVLCRSRRWCVQWECDFDRLRGSLAAITVAVHTWCPCCRLFSEWGAATAGNVVACGGRLRGIPAKI